VTEGPVIVQMIETFSPLLQPVTLLQTHDFRSRSRHQRACAKERDKRSRLHRYLTMNERVPAQQDHLMTA
jgi:hypothetical protein